MCGQLYRNPKTPFKLASIFIVEEGSWPDAEM